MIELQGDPTKVPVPTLEESYSGIASRLLPEASRWKELLHKESDGVPHEVALPPGISLDQFKIAVPELKSLVGANNVEINDKPLEDGWYMEHPKTHDTYSIFDKHDLVASAVCTPGSTDEVVSVVKWANKFGIPLYPISMGRNLGYGGAAPRVRGSIVLDVGRRMNKVLDLNEDTATCLVEPGVSYFALYDAIEKSGYDLMMDCPDIGGGSVMGNALDHGMGYTPMGDHWGAHCGMEVVLPTGNVIRTGMGAMPQKSEEYNSTWQSFNYGYGPYADGIFSQSNYGIVTKMGFHLQPKMDSQTYLFTFDRYEDYKHIIKTVQKLVMKREIHCIPQITPSLMEPMASFLKKKSEIWDGEGPIPLHVTRDWLEKNSPLGACSWLVYATNYGPPSQTVPQIHALHDKLKAAFPGTKLFLPSDLPPWHYIQDKVRVFKGIPSLRELFWMNYVPNSAHLGFSPIVPPGEQHAEAVYSKVAPILARHGFDQFTTFIVAPRHTLCVCMIMFDRSSPHQRRAVFAAMRELIETCRREGYGEYRTHLLLADQVARAYSWNDGSLLRFHESVKDALDPKGILAPGRNGIWPERYRREGGWPILYDDENRMVSDPVGGVQQRL